MDYRTGHGYDGDSTGVSSSAPETAEGQEMRTRIDALEHAVTKLTQQLAALTSPRAAAPAKAPQATLPELDPHQLFPTKAPPPAPTAPALAAGITMKAPPMTQADRRKKEEEEQAKEQEKEEANRRRLERLKKEEAAAASEEAINQEDEKEEEFVAAAEAADWKEVAASRSCLDAGKMKEDEAAKAAFFANETAAARKRLKEEEACSRSSWSEWDGNQSGWKDKQGWNQHNWGNIWQQR